VTFSSTLLPLTQVSLPQGLFTLSTQAMTDIMVRCANEAAGRWCEKLQTGPGELDMQYEFSRLTLDVIGRAAFGTGGAASEVVAADEVYIGMNKLLEEKVGRIMSGMEFIPGYR
jgi:hypothetical protein